jgi:hypothetical protein
MARRRVHQKAVASSMEDVAVPISEIKKDIAPKVALKVVGEELPDANPVGDKGIHEITEAMSVEFDRVHGCMCPNENCGIRKPLIVRSEPWDERSRTRIRYHHCMCGAKFKSIEQA